MATFPLPPVSDVGPNSGTAVPGGPHFLHLDDDPHDGDASYVFFSAPGFEVLGWDPTAIAVDRIVEFVIVRWTAKAGGSLSPYTARAGVRIGGVDTFGAIRTLTPTYTTYEDLFVSVPTGPSSGNKWSRAALLAADLSFEMIAVPVALPRPRLTSLVGVAELAEPAARVSVRIPRPGGRRDGLCYRQP